MAGYRQFYTRFWKDEWVIDLDPLEKYLYSYLFTNELSSISGIYKLPLKIICYETGLDQEFVRAAFDKFEQASKILYRDGVMWVVNMSKYHANASETTQKKVTKDIDSIPDCLVKDAYRYHLKNGGYGIDTVSILVSLRKREREREIKKESETADAAPATPNPLPSIQEAHDIWTTVTGMTAMPGNAQEQQVKYDKVISLCRDKTRQEAVEFLRTYWKAWLDRGYKKVNPAWLDWAVAGEIPDAKKEAVNPAAGYTSAWTN